MLRNRILGPSIGDPIADAKREREWAADILLFKEPNFKETFWVGLIKHRKSTEKKMLFEEED